MASLASLDAHPSEDQLGFFGFTPEGSLVVTVPADAGEGTATVVLPVGFPDYRFPDVPTNEGGPRAMVRANLEAIRVLRRLEEESRSRHARGAGGPRALRGLGALPRRVRGEPPRSGGASDGS